MNLNLSELLNRTQDKARKLPLKRAIVAWFGGEAARHSRYVPLESLSCVVLVRSRRSYTYREGARLKKAAVVRDEHPVLMAMAPVIYHNNSIVVGGDGWRRYRKASKVHYTQDTFSGAEPVGSVRDVLCREYKNPLSLIISSDHKHNRYHRKLLRWAYRMLEEPLLQPTAGLSSQQSIIPPTFLVPKLRKPLTLRIGEELEQWTMHCATTGRWTIPGGPMDVGHTETQDRGEVRVIDEENLEFSCTVKGGEFTDTYNVEYARQQYEARIEEIFGRDDIVVPLVPLVRLSGSVPVKRNQALWGPVAKKNWTKKEFRALPEETRMAAFYLAALNSSQLIDGTYYLDFTHAYGEAPPIVDLQSLKDVLQGAENTPHGLSYQVDGVRVDMLRFIRYHLHLHADERKSRKEQMTAGKVDKKTVSVKPAASQSTEAKAVVKTSLEHTS